MLKLEELRALKLQQEARAAPLEAQEVCEVKVISSPIRALDHYSARALSIEQGEDGHTETASVGCFCAVP